MTKKKVSKKSSSKRHRVNMRIPEDLLKWAKAYVKRKNTSLTQAVVDHFTKLRTEEPLDV